MKKISVAVDLDDTLVTSNTTFIFGDLIYKYKIRNRVIETIYNLHSKYEFHLITARENTDENYREVKKICKDIQCKVNKLINKNDDLFQFQSITLTSRERKCQFANDFDCTYIIDDYLEIVSDYGDYGIMPLLIVNKQKHRKKLMKNKNIHAFTCWREIEEFLIK